MRPFLPRVTASEDHPPKLLKLARHIENRQTEIDQLRKETKVLEASLDRHDVNADFGPLFLLKMKTAEAEMTLVPRLLQHLHATSILEAAEQRAKQDELRKVEGDLLERMGIPEGEILPMAAKQGSPEWHRTYRAAVAGASPAMPMRDIEMLLPRIEAEIQEYRSLVAAEKARQVALKAPKPKPKLEQSQIQHQQRQREIGQKEQERRMAAEALLR